MKDEILAHLHDVLQSGRAIKESISNRTLESYTSDELLRSAVERKFEIMGEAVHRIKRDDPSLLSRIRNYRTSFRSETSWFTDMTPSTIGLSL